MFCMNAEKINGRHSVKLHANMNKDIYIFLKNESFLKKGIILKFLSFLHFKPLKDRMKIPS